MTKKARILVVDDEPAMSRDTHDDRLCNGRYSC